MFLPNSRYHKVATVAVKRPDGTEATALKLRRILPLEGDPVAVVAGDRLDLFAHARFGDATRFWHVADANTTLDSRSLTAVPGDTLLVPRS